MHEKQTSIIKFALDRQGKFEIPGLLAFISQTFVEVNLRFKSPPMIMLGSSRAFEAAKIS